MPASSQPLTGARLPAGGWDELMRLGYEDAVPKLDGPVAHGAAEELAPAFAELRARLGFYAGPVGVMGGSIGAAVAQVVLAEADLAVAAAVLISPVVRLRPVVDSMAAAFGFAYRWSEESAEVARRLDFLPRAAELAAALGERYGSHERAQVVSVPGMAHALAEEPGTPPAPQTPHAAIVDGCAVRWFERHLVDQG